MKLKLFETDRLNEIGEQLIELDNFYSQYVATAKKNMLSAFKTRWEYGKLISENYDYIVENCGTQKVFAEVMGKTEAVISNNKRAYEYLLQEGCGTWEEVAKKLQERRIPLTIRSFERIKTLLNEPTTDTTQIEQIDKDQLRLEELIEEANEILRRTEPASKPELHEDLEDVIQNIEAIRAYIESFDITKRQWKSEKYLNFVRSFGYDIVTKEPCERCDPHHTNFEGGSGGTGDKLSDFMTIPVSRDTHMMLESGFLTLSKEETAIALATTMATFISSLKL